MSRCCMPSFSLVVNILFYKYLSVLFTAEGTIHQHVLCSIHSECNKPLQFIETKCPFPIPFIPIVNTTLFILNPTQSPPMCV